MASCLYRTAKTSNLDSIAAALKAQGARRLFCMRTKCAEKETLLASIQEALKRIIALNNREMEAVMAGIVLDDSALQEELGKAREKQKFLMREFKQHIAEHDC
jgi:hypothetical protein